NDTFLPRQTSKENGGIPYQLQLKELKAILEVQEKHFPFLTKKDDDGRTVSEKICSILSFRVPYYVGPVNDAHKREDGGFCWIVRKEPGPVRPWNFEEKVDLDKSGEAFIRRMTSTCTYLIGAEVLPKDSLLYSRFMVLNELNNLKLNGEKLPVEWKQDIYEKLCIKRSRVTLKAIKDYLISTKGISKADELSGIDEELKGTLKSERDFRRILGNDFDATVAEECILTLVLFSEEKRMVRRRLAARFGDRLSSEQLTDICRLRYSGWGRLSREFLTEIYDTNPATGEAVSIISALWNTNENLMQLLSSAHQFKQRIDERNAEINGAETDFSYESMVEPLYCSPVVKHSIWRALVIVKELEKILGHAPEKVFVEMAREEGEKERTVSRKNRLKALYKKIGKQANELSALLEQKSDAELRQKKLYLYFTQMGKCMYSGRPISLSDLNDENKYDIDHIYPRSLTKDDSLDNLVLVERRLNRDKSDDYPLRDNYRQHELWKMLLGAELISKKKYDRLVSVSPLTEDQLSGFIARQLVETRQSTKAVAEVLQKLYGRERVVFVKAGNVSDFRHDEKHNFVKVRELNDLHHAKDAYLNIVVGNVFHTKFTADPRNFIRRAPPRSYSLTKMFDFDVSRGGVTAWKAGEDGTIATVKKTMAGNRILFTRYPFEFGGEFYDQMPMKKGHGQIPRKSADPRFADIDKYGGYNNDSTAYFFLVRHTVKGKEARTIEYVPVRLADKLRGDESALLEYCSGTLGLLNSEILIPEIKLNTMFVINGFPMHISGRTGNSITFKVAAQLVLTDEQTAYLKKVCKFNERVKAKVATEPTKSDGITAEDNLKLYKALLEKHKNTVYKNRPAQQIELLKEGEKKFPGLSLKDQCAALGNILVLFKCVFARADLSLIGGSKQAGTVGVNKNMMGNSSARIIYQSPTGLFENSVDLLGAFGI
ncbi:MAG: type II CRISPR RNA-guided endonuclease Cas9, partial [Oscillospiraceae bacterium]|nr:type II CRISPR RNA-guided endonuclease Cas9 [Oscillospiraceae bacterium]